VSPDFKRGKPVKAKKTGMVRVTRFRSFFHLGLALTGGGPQALKRGEMQDKAPRKKDSFDTKKYFHYFNLSMLMNFNIFL
jgi:hypothetical protein